MSPFRRKWDRGQRGVSPAPCQLRALYPGPPPWSLSLAVLSSSLVPGVRSLNPPGGLGGCTPGPWWGLEEPDKYKGCTAGPLKRSGRREPPQILKWVSDGGPALTTCPGVPSSADLGKSGRLEAAGLATGVWWWTGWRGDVAGHGRSVVCSQDLDALALPPPPRQPEGRCCMAMAVG